MCKKIAFLFFVFLALPLLSAAQIDLKTNFSQGETLFAKASGNFIENVQKENVLFYRDHVRISLEPYDVIKINDDFYIYAHLGDKQPGNYSVRIEDVQYFLGTQITEEDVRGNFTITSEKADFSVKPGIIITDEPFSIELQNLKTSEIFVEANETYSEPVNLKSGEIKNLDFGLGSETSFRTIEVKTEKTIYEILVYAFVDPSQNPEQEQENQNETSKETEENKFEEQNNKTSQPQNETSETEGKIKSATTKTCEELGGNVCSENQQCSGDSEYAKDGVCCIGTCQEKESSNTGRIIGWSLIVIIVLVLLWFFKKKYKKAKRDVDLFKISRGKRR